MINKDCLWEKVTHEKKINEDRDSAYDLGHSSKAAKEN